MDNFENPRFRPYREDMDEEELKTVLEKDAQALQDQQDAERILFLYIIATAKQPEIHPDIPLALSAYLGKVNDLPSGRILEAALPLPKGEKAQKCAKALSKALEDLAPDVPIPTAKDIHHDGQKWITVNVLEATGEERKAQHRGELWRPLETVTPSRAILLGEDPVKRSSRFFLGRAILLLLVGVAIYLAIRTFGCSADMWRKNNIENIPVTPATVYPLSVNSTAPGSIEEIQ